MEFPHGRSDGFYITAEDDQETTSKSHTFLPPASSSSSPSSSSSSAHAFHWHDGSSGSGGGDGEQAGGSAGGSDGAFVEKEPMFDKVVTPSDVGKLNRLVIPKQHAERFFPLDASANEKGLLLCFEDRTGKSWRFRYSYWNSSQSYVMTKGWSRFVKEKRLDAGDTVSFSRGVGEAGRDRLFIDWKRRPENHDLPRMPPIPLQGVGVSFAQPWPGARLFVPPPSAMYNQSFQAYGCYNRSNAASSSNTGGQLLYFSRPAAAPRPPQYGVQLGGNAALPMVLDAVPVVHNQASTSKRVRLFGVNLECPESESEGDRRNGQPASSTVLHLQQRPAFPLLRLPPGSAESSAASSPSTSKEQHSSLDLDL